jgi:hypothetical protein
VEGDAGWAWVSGTPLETARADVVIFASSVKDAVALSLARDAEAQGIPTIHVIDSWTMYRDRMATDGRPPFIPTLYAVIDDLAAESAAAAGIPRAVLRITGQPALDLTGTHVAAGISHHDKVRLLFVSEPAAADQGTSAASPTFRGYTEATVLPLFCRALQPLAGTLEVHLLPHPREKPGEVEAAWAAHKGNLQGAVMAQNALEGLGRFDGIAGMASLLLYQAWLLGRPVLSIQPGLRVDALRQIGQRQGVVLIDQAADATEKIYAWATGVAANQPLQPRPELALHARSAEHILTLAQDLTSKNPGKAKTP